MGANTQQQGGRQPAPDITANAEAVLAAAQAEHDPDDEIYDETSELLEESILLLPRKAVAGLRAADSSIAESMKEQRLWCRIIEAVANGVDSDLRGNRMSQDATRAEAEERSPRLEAAIDQLAKQVGDLLGVPEGEAYARRWICYAIEEYC